MAGYYAASKEEALKTALSLIPEGSSVTMGGAMSAHEIGLVDAVKAGNYNFIDRDTAEDKRAAMLAAYDADVFLSSVNAMTDDGILVNIDGNANRVSAICQGPKKVLFIVGMNKVCGDLDGAMNRQMHGLQEPGHHLLPVPGDALQPPRRPHPRHPGQRFPRILIRTDT